jgi:hypothetical protein
MLLSFSGLKKSKDDPVGYGCVNRNIKEHIIYNNFGGENYKAWLLYDQQDN